MLIEEIVRTCTNHLVAEPAVASIGMMFLAEVRDRAAAYDMTVGAFTALSIDRFLRHGDEGELRSVISSMRGSQEPVLAGLHRILCIMLACGVVHEDRAMRGRTPRIAAQLHFIDADCRHELFA